MAAGGPPMPAQLHACRSLDHRCNMSAVQWSAAGRPRAPCGGTWRRCNKLPVLSPALPPLTSVNAGQQPSSSAAAPLTARSIAALTAGNAMKCISEAVNGTRVATCCLLCCGQLPCPDAGAQLLHMQWALGPASRCQQVQAVQSHYIQGSEPAERRHQGGCQHFCGRLTCR